MVRLLTCLASLVSEKIFESQMVVIYLRRSWPPLHGSSRRLPSYLTAAEWHSSRTPWLNARRTYAASWILSPQPTECVLFLPTDRNG